MSISTPALGARTMERSGSCMRQGSMQDTGMLLSAQIPKKRRRSRKAGSSTKEWKENMSSSAAAAERSSGMPERQKHIQHLTGTAAAHAAEALRG